MAKMTRRKFLKMATATAVGAMAAGCTSGTFIYPDREGLAASTSPEIEKYSICVMCNHTAKCGTKLIIKDNKIFRTEKWEGYPNNMLCTKGIAAMQEIYDPDRLLYPVKRTTPKGSPDPGWVRISWDEAISTIAEKLNGIKQRYGADKVLFYAGDPKEPRPALQRLAYTFGSPNFGTESSTCYKATELSAKLTYGQEWYTASALAIGGAPSPDTGACIFWSTNFPWSGPFQYNRLKNVKERGNTKFIVIDPRVTPLAHAFADVHIQPRCGTDGALALCFGNYLIENNAYDKAFVDRWVHGFEEYKAYVRQFTIERAAQICEVPAAKIRAACEIITNRNGPLMVRSSAAAPHHSNAVQGYRARLLLAPLTGSIDVPGSVMLPNEPLNFSEFHGSPEFDRFGDLLPKLDHLRVDRQFVPVWADTDNEGTIQTVFLPEYVKAGQLRAAFMTGVNTMMWPQTPEYQEAFRNMEFTAATDFHIRPQSHNYMDMVLPAAMAYERMAPLAVFGRNIYLRDPAVTPPGEVRTDWRICADVGTALGYSREFFGGGPNAEEEMVREVLRTSKTGVTLEQLRAARPAAVTVPLKDGPKIRKYELGLLRPDGQPGFTSPTGKIEFTSEIMRQYGFNPLPVYEEPVYSPVRTPSVFREFPLILNTGARVPMFTHSKQRNLPWLKQLMPEPIVRLYPTDAAARGLKEGDYVRITSPANRTGIRVKLEVTNILKPGMIDMFHSWEQADVNLLVSRDFCKVSGFPPFKEGLCQVVKA